MNTIESFYNANPQLEWERFERHRTEFAVTKRALAEYLPPPPARILDCGGGPGRYAIHLASLGYQVTLLDLAEGNLALAREKAAEAGVEIVSFIHGNALDLPDFADESFDAVLLLGPLYHLVSAEDRLRAAREALRVLRPGGPLFAGFITMYAPFRDALAKGYPQDVVDDADATRALLEDQRVSAGFTDAWCAYPAQVQPLMEEAGARTLALLAAEGLAAGNEKHVNELTGAAFEFWADLNNRFCRDPHLLGAADHILYIGAK